MTGLREIFAGSGARTPVRMIITLGWWVLCPLGALGQTVPTDLLDLSIDELFDANIVTEADQLERSRKWHVSYTYAVSDYGEYYIGSSSVTYEDVLFRPGVDARTENNYSVVPTEITQEVHAISVGYDLSPATTVRVQLPFVM